MIITSITATSKYPQVGIGILLQILTFILFSSSVYTAAIIGYLDPSWLTERNVHYINTLVRDFANPIRGERFPFSRSFDWFQ